MPDILKIFHGLQKKNHGVFVRIPPFLLCFIILLWKKTKSGKKVRFLTNTKSDIHFSFAFVAIRDFFFFFFSGTDLIGSDVLVLSHINSCQTSKVRGHAKVLEP